MGQLEGLEGVVLLALQAAGFTLLVRDVRSLIFRPKTPAKPWDCDACMPIWSVLVVLAAMLMVRYFVPQGSVVLSVLAGVGLAGIVIRQSPRPSSSQPPMLPPPE